MLIMDECAARGLIGSCHSHILALLAGGRTFALSTRTDIKFNEISEIWTLFLKIESHFRMLNDLYLLFSNAMPVIFDANSRGWWMPICLWSLMASRSAQGAGWRPVQILSWSSWSWGSAPRLTWSSLVFCSWLAYSFLLSSICCRLMLEFMRCFSTSALSHDKID